MKALIRTDASPTIGGGHVMRCLVLADALAQLGWDCVFACVDGTPATVPLLAASKHQIVEIPAVDIQNPEALQPLAPADLLVVDHYGLGAHFESAARVIARHIMVLDDAPGRPHDCDLLLDQTFGRRAAEYSQSCLVPADCRLLVGTDYALLRPQFAQYRLEGPVRLRRQVRRLLVSFGATDPSGLTVPAVEAALAAGIDAIDVAIGSAAPHLAELREVTARRSGVSLHLDADMPPLMMQADLALGAAGSTAWERCCVGLPSLVVVAADNQADVAQALQNAAAAEALPVEDLRNPDKARMALQRLMSDSGHVASLSMGSLQVCDGFGGARTALEVAARLHPSGGVTLRRATMDDAALLYDWQCAPETRRFARNREMFSYEQHVAWLCAKLRQPTSMLQIMQHAGEAVGFVRIDKTTDPTPDGAPMAEVSIAVAPGKHGRGLGLAGLNALAAMVPKFGLLAYVMPENGASRALFLRAGYEPRGKDYYLKPPAEKLARHVA